ENATGLGSPFRGLEMAVEQGKERIAVPDPVLEPVGSSEHQPSAGGRRDSYERSPSGYPLWPRREPRGPCEERAHRKRHQVETLVLREERARDHRREQNRCARGEVSPCPAECEEDGHGPESRDVVGGCRKARVVEKD